MLFFENIFMLIFGHALADFVLQPEVMAKIAMIKFRIKNTAYVQSGTTG
jgi:hypothetical protein|tara:strand:- start:111 stop:257 length:147 start_codon:yes stop_codon:yes gene_type:complete